MKNQPLTKREANVLDFLKRYHEKWGYMPTVREIAKAFGFESPASPHALLGKLEGKGYIIRKKGVSRNIIVL